MQYFAVRFGATTVLIARGSANMRKSNGALTFFVIAIFLLSAGMAWLIRQMQSLNCPAGTFLSGSGATNGQIIAILLVWMGFALATASWLANIATVRNTVRNFVDPDARNFRGMVNFLVMVLSLPLSFSAWASFSHYCLSARDILYQPYPWTSLQQYSWHDVTMIKNSCGYKKVGSYAHLFLTMSDGVSFTITGTPLLREYPEMVHALQGVNFAFSADISPDCPAYYAAMLTRRP